MDEQKKEGFDFKPDAIADAEEDVPVDKKYNFDLFTENRGKNVDSGTAAPTRKPSSRPMRKDAKPINTEPKNEFSTDAEEKTEVKGVNLDDDFQIGGGFKATEISEPSDARQSRRPRPEQNDRNNKAGKNRRPSSDKKDNTTFAEYFAANKVKVITTFVLAAIAIIAIAALGSGMRIDIFGITNTMLVIGLLIFAVLLVVLGVFIKQRHRVIYGFLWVFIILIFAGCFAGIVLSGVCDFFGISRTHTISDFTIPEDGNWGTSTIADELYEEGVINHPFLFRVYSKIKGYDGTYQWGNYELNSEMDYGTIMYELRQGNTAATVQIRIPEAASVDDIIKLFEENNVCTRDQFIEAMDEGDYKYSWVTSIPVSKVRYRFEGYLYPDTYNFYAEPSVDNAEKAIDKMLSAFNSHLPENWHELVAEVGKRIDKADMTLNDCLAIGSILELEASGNENEMKNVASVFYNRLTWSEPRFLGSTPTYYYSDNRYNTNAGPMTVELEDGTEKTYPAGNEGIPPGPQCSLTESAILACLQPADTDYTYFVTDVDMNFYYNKSYTAHLNTIAKLRNSGKWA